MTKLVHSGQTAGLWLCRAALTDTVGLQPALPGMGRTGYAPAEQARAERLDHIQSPKAQTPGRAAALHSLRHTAQAATGAGDSSPGTGPAAAAKSHETGAEAAGNSPGPVAEGTEEHHVELSRFSVAASVESCGDVYGAPAPMLISRYERNPPPETVEGRPGQYRVCVCVCVCVCVRVRVCLCVHWYEASCPVCLRCLPAVNKLLSVLPR